ncbi:hypothetical protein J437_LFUL013965 [Ladona fulva]|uniref:Uncharacterized protein n=1 Tax=Ladona fulva TaxID=123851 RepID=A0A8K0KD85_LADFU|nr:hypothetical protein J437_LFUL013965 [Ladona fulva]
MPSKERRDSESSSSASEKTDSAFSEGSRGSREPDDHSSSFAATGTREPSISPQGMLIEKRMKEYSEIEEDASIVQNASYGSNIPRSSENVNYGTKSRKHSETSEESFSDSSPKKRFKAATFCRDFNLDEKIEALPSLSLEEFQLKKKAKKKRNTPSVKRNTNTKAKKDESQSVDTKVKIEQESTVRTEGDSQQSSLEAEGSSFSVPLVGSQKRKARKQCITRLDPEGSAGRDTAVVAQEVLNNIGLATLAEVAAAKKRLTK